MKGHEENNVACFCKTRKNSLVERCTYINADDLCAADLLMHERINVKGTVMHEKKRENDKGSKHSLQD